MKRVTACLLVLIMMLPSNSSKIYASSEKLSYEVSLRQRDGVENNLFWTPHSTYSMENLNDGDPDTINQVEYHSPTGEDMYENLLLKDPFYIILDLKKAYDLESIEINWYPKGGRCYKYIVSGSLDDKTYVEIANHADNVTEPNAIKDTFKGVTARFIRIEVLGNYRPSDGTYSEYFPVSEITVKGTLSENQPEPVPSPEPGLESIKIDYVPDIRNMDGVEHNLIWTGAFPVEHINDGIISNVVQIEYSGWFDGETGVLDEPFYIELDLKKAYELDCIDIYWFLKADKYYMYKVYTSLFGDEYDLQIDRSGNTQKGRIKDEFDNVTARYVRIEMVGNYIPSEQTANQYYAFHELNVFGRLSEEQPTTKPATPTPMPTSTPDVTQTAKSTPTPDMTPESVVDGDDKEVRQWIVVVASVAVLAVVATVVFVIIKKKGKGEKNV